VAGFRVSSRTHGSIEVPASNWLVALGKGLETFGVVGDMERIACEVLPNGSILVRDVRSGQGFVVQASDGPVAEEEPSDADFVSTEDDDDPETARETLVTPLLAAVSQAPTRQQSVDAALECARALLHAEAGSVLLYEPGGALVFAGAFGPESAKLQNLAIAAGTGFAGFVANRNAALSIREPYQDTRFCRAIDARTGYRTQSLLVVPVSLKGRVYGVIEVLNAAAPHGFDASSMGLLSRIASTLAVRLVAAGEGDS
jgi:GAF domain-containing protein